MANKAFFRLLPVVAHVSHRGGAAMAPENTLLAFRHAVELWRTDQVELDVRVSRDGVPVVIHDETVDRTTDGSGPVAGLTLSEIKALDAAFRFAPDGRRYPLRGTGIKVPTLREILREIEVPAMIDLKECGPLAREAVVDAVLEARAVARVCLGSEDDGCCCALSRLRPDAALFFPERAARDFVAAAVEGRAIAETPYDVLALPAQSNGADVIGEPVLGAARARGLRVQVRTVDDVRSMRRYVARGVDGIQTDRPDLLRAVLDGDRAAA
jgi:glycerophosphoryl diester phosphodiesterase